MPPDPIQEQLRHIASRCEDLPGLAVNIRDLLTRVRVMQANIDLLGAHAESQDNEAQVLHATLQRILSRLAEIATERKEP